MLAPQKEFRAARMTKTERERLVGMVRMSRYLKSKSKKSYRVNVAGVVDLFHGPAHQLHTVPDNERHAGAKVHETSQEQNF